MDGLVHIGDQIFYGCAAIAAAMAFRSVLKFVADLMSLRD